VFCSRGLRLLGVYSYALYVFHHPIVILMKRKHLTVAELLTLFGSQLGGAMFYILVSGGTLGDSSLGKLASLRGTLPKIERSILFFTES
jgi:hypothetical protein